MQIPDGLTVRDEWHAVRRMQTREVKTELLAWGLQLAEWRTKADLTFASIAHPERAEKAVRRWLRKVARDSWAIVGYERQHRGAVHAHVVVSRELDRPVASGLWNVMAGFCRIERVNSAAEATRYVIQHAVKEMDFEIIGPTIGGVGPRGARGQERLPLWASPGGRERCTEQAYE